MHAFTGFSPGCRDMDLGICTWYFIFTIVRIWMLINCKHVVVNQSSRGKSNTITKFGPLKLWPYNRSVDESGR